MTWLTLVIIGLIVLVLGFVVPGPPPWPTVCRVLGGLLVGIGLILFIVSLVAYSGPHTVDGLRPLYALSSLR